MICNGPLADVRSGARAVCPGLVLTRSGPRRAPSGEWRPAGRASGPAPVGGKSLEEDAKEEAASFRKHAARIDLAWRPEICIRDDLVNANHYDELASILAGARLKEYIPLLRLRSLLARGRARHGPETTVVAARLFECFWRVVEYAWLGDWRRP